MCFSEEPIIKLLIFFIPDDLVLEVLPGGLEVLVLLGQLLDVCLHLLHLPGVDSGGRRHLLAHLTAANTMRHKNSIRSRSIQHGKNWSWSRQKGSRAAPQHWSIPVQLKQTIILFQKILSVLAVN